jgi:hypothetical protein
VRSSVKPSQAANDNPTDRLVAYTRQIWEPRLGRNLSCEDIREITENLTGFFGLLAQWSREEGPTTANDNDTGKSTRLIVDEEQPTIGRDRGGRGHD